jgi:hypothetical protein
MASADAFTPDGAPQALAPYIVIDDRDDVWDAVSRPAILKVKPFIAFNANGTIKTPSRDAHARQAAAAVLRPLGVPPLARREALAPSVTCPQLSPGRSRAC